MTLTGCTKKARTETNERTDNSNSTKALSPHLTIVTQLVANKILQCLTLLDLHSYHLLSKEHNITAKASYGLHFARINSGNFVSFPITWYRKWFFGENPPSLQRFTSVSCRGNFPDETRTGGNYSERDVVVNALKHSKATSVQIEHIPQPFAARPSCDFLLDLINSEVFNSRKLTCLEFPGFRSPRKGQMTTVCKSHLFLTSLTVPADTLGECLELDTLNKLMITMSKGVKVDAQTLIGNNPDLRSLTINGELDFDVMPSLSNLRNLQSLVLDVAKAMAFSQLPATLKSFTLRSHEPVKLSLDVKSLPYLPKLTHLELININELDIIAILQKCPNVISLKIYSNITNFAALLQAVNKAILQKFHLGFYDLDCDLDRPLKWNSSLCGIEAKNCHFFNLTGDILSQFEMPKLRSLMLASGDIKQLNTPSQLPFYIGRGKFTGYEALKKRCPKLEAVGFFGCNEAGNRNEVIDTQEKLRSLFKIIQFARNYSSNRDIIIP